MERIPLRVKGFRSCEALNVKQSVLRFQLIPRLRWRGIGSLLKSRSLRSLALSQDGKASITEALLEATLCRFKLDFDSIVCVRFRRSMASFSVGTDVYIEVVQHKVLSIGSAFRFAKFCCSSQGIYCDCWRRTIAKDVYSHSVVNYLLFCTVVLVPKKAKIVAMLLFYLETIEHSFYVCHHSYFLPTEAQQHTQKCIVEVRTAQ